MGELKQRNIKNRAYYFYNDIINLDQFDESKIKVDKEDFNDIDIYYLGYEHKKKISECDVKNSVNPLYLRIADMNGQFEKSKDDALYLIISGNDNFFKNLQIFLKVLKIKLQIKQGTLQNTIKVT